LIFTTQQSAPQIHKFFSVCPELLPNQTEKIAEFEGTLLTGKYRSGFNKEWILALDMSVSMTDVEENVVRAKNHLCVKCRV